MMHEATTLSAVDVDELHARYAADPQPDVEAELVHRHSRLAYSLANRFAGRGEPTEDLEQVAMAGLWIALRRFDAGRGLRFSTFATPTILGELKRHLRDRAWLVKPPRPVQEAYLATRQASEELERELTRQPTVEELVAATNLSSQAVTDGLTAGAGRWASASLDAPVAGHDDIVLHEALADESQDFAAAENGLFVAALLGAVQEPARTALTLRYLENASQREIANRLGISQMTVSRTIDRALRQLRRISARETHAA
jgi:RNA polymerase sigma-B factor